MTSNKKRATYRLTPELDEIITEEAKRQGVSKNALVQITLGKALIKDFEIDKQTRPTGTDN